MNNCLKFIHFNNISINASEIVSIEKYEGDDDFDEGNDPTYYVSIFFKLKNRRRIEVGYTDWEYDTNLENWKKYINTKKEMRNDLYEKIKEFLGSNDSDFTVNAEYERGY